MDTKTILVVEDNDRLRRFIVSALIKAGYQTLTANSVKAAYEHLRAACLDMVLLDLRLGDLDGLEILKTIRRQDENLPVIIISSIQDQGTKLDGFTIGCDDYIAKPFYIDELLARIKRLLSRLPAIPNSGPTLIERLCVGPFELDFGSMQAFRNGQALAMRKKLLDLLQYFMRNPEKICSPAALCMGAWSADDTMTDNSLYVHIRQLRQIIEDDPSNPRYIKTLRHIGYMFTVKEPAGLEQQTADQP
jgi:DNA-binding response OmpR family regulator